MPAKLTTKLGNIMYIIIEHNGLPNTMELVEELEMMLEEEGHVPEQVVTSTDVVSLLDKDYDIIANFDKTPSEEILRFYVELANGED